MEHYCVRVSSEQMTFSAGHFITFGQDTCEPLHGHDYRVAAEVYGALDENQCVLDFIALRDRLVEILAELDHRVLLPSESPSIRVVEGPEEIEARFADRRWVFPRGDCVLLPVANTTAELLARHVARRLRDELASRCGVRPARLRIELAESPGFAAVCELSGVAGS